MNFEVVWDPAFEPFQDKLLIRMKWLEAVIIEEYGP
jgi:hypothetical protein